jgi:protein-S-isoprenylcysteine O-methyltransferase Ste14
MSLIGDFPQTVVALTVWAYWSSVCVLVVRSHIRYRTSAGGLPRTARERWMWALWVPAIILWQVFPAVAAFSSSPLLGTPQVALSNPLMLTFRYLAAGLAATAFVLTIPNWLGMGKNWSMAIVPGKKCRLITSGMFSYVRHPIYALSILLMLSTMAVTLTPAMTLIGVIHITMLYMKAISEERFLTQMHGEAYSDYCQRTGRFAPRLFHRDDTNDEETVRKAA